jgi:uncharacterized repeat protein (TIGR03803 family)
MKRVFLITLAVFAFVLPGVAQYTTLHDFANDGNGMNPRGSLVTDSTWLYGMTTEGSNIFKIKTDGTGYTVLHTLSPADGLFPYGSLYYDGTYLYGTAQDSGAHLSGTIFKIKTDGTGFTKLHDFTGNVGEGEHPKGSLMSDGTWLYGTTRGGTASSPIISYGTIFRIKPDGSSYTVLHDFSNIPDDGRQPHASLVSDGTWLYGTTIFGGVNTNFGTIFKIMPDGTGYAKLFDFGNLTGEQPYGDLIYDGTWLYGMTAGGGPNGWGTIFKIKPDGTNFTSLFSFSTPGMSPDGCTPFGSLLYDGIWLYGMTSSGSNVFKIKPDGTNFTNMYIMTPPDGSLPYGSVISDGAYLYGMTYQRGVNMFYGTVFKLDINAVAVGITQSEKTDMEVNVYPNPASGSLTIEWKTPKVKENKAGKYTITDLLGKIVQNSTVNFENATATIDIHDLPNGVYFLKTGNRILKFVKN